MFPKVYLGLFFAAVMCAVGLMLLFQMRPAAPLDNSASPSTAAVNLARFHEGLVARYPRTNHLTSVALNDLSADQILLFDVREAEEFEVSHLQGAIQIAPDMSAAQFLNLYGEGLVGKTLVFYCSVGERSSKFAQAVGDATQGLSIANLEGGIFKWHNEFRPVVNAAGPTNAVHPFNDFWGRLLKRQEAIANYSQAPLK